MKLREVFQRLFFKISYLKNEKLKQFFVSVIILLLLSFIILAIILVRQNSENKIKKNILETISQSQNKTSINQPWQEETSGASENESEILSAAKMSGRDYMLVVFICGEIKNPGVYKMPDGSRINDLIITAGGAGEKACLELINPAQKLVDGQKIYIPSVDEKREYILSFNEDAASDCDSSAVKKININLASKKELESLPGIGSELASRIIKYRETNGGFQNIESLKKVNGIGEKKFSDIKEMITV